MTLREARALLDYWQDSPPENEMLAMLAQAYTTWRPAPRGTTAEEHRRSLEERWKAGAMNAKQLVEVFGGGKSFAMKLDGTPMPLIGAMPGVGELPGVAK